MGVGKRSSPIPLVESQSPKRIKPSVRTSTGFIKVPHSRDDGKTHFLQFPGTKSLDVFGQRTWPSIFFGHHSPLPRWKLVPVANAQLGDDLEAQLISTYGKRTHIPGIPRGSHPRSNDSSLGLGALDWKFEYGPEEGFKGLSHGQVYEYAYRSLVDAMYDYICRNQMREWIRRQGWARIKNVDDPLPPVRYPPKHTEFGPRAGVDNGTYIPVFEPLPKEHRLFEDFRRPSLAFPTSLDFSKSARGEDKNSEQRARIIDLLRRNGKSTNLLPGQISRSFNPTIDSIVVHGEPQSSFPQSQGGSLGAKFEEICEYKCVSFTVILLILAMFLSLFLYGFKIIK